MPQPSYSPDLTPHDFFVPDTENTHERTEIWHDFGDSDRMAGARQHPYTRNACRVAKKR